MCILSCIIMATWMEIWSMILSVKGTKFKPGMIILTYNPQHSEDESSRIVSSRPAWGIWHDVSAKPSIRKQDLIRYFRFPGVCLIVNVSETVHVYLLSQLRTEQKYICNYGQQVLSLPALYLIFPLLKERLEILFSSLFWGMGSL